MPTLWIIYITFYVENPDKTLMSENSLKVPYQTYILIFIHFIILLLLPISKA